MINRCEVCGKWGFSWNMKPVSIGPHYPWSFCQTCYTEFKGGEKPKEQDQSKYDGWQEEERGY